MSKENTNGAGKAKIWCSLFFLICLSSSNTLLAAACEYRILNQWGDGFTVEVLIANDTSEAIQGWSVTWAYTDGSTVTQSWNATFTGANPFTASSSSTIPANSSTTFGFNGSKSIQGADAEIPELGGICTSQTNFSALSYTLDTQRSSLYFVSTKQTHILETHHFTNINGAISDDGEANLTIDLSSVETGIEIRNERVRNFLFEVGSFSNAVIRLPVDLTRLSALSVGDINRESISATLNLHGLGGVIDTEVIVTKLSDDKIMVQNSSPILIHAGDYNLIEGIEELRNIANLSMISYSVPVNFTLVFNAIGSQ